MFVVLLVLMLCVFAFMAFVNVLTFPCSCIDGSTQHLSGLVVLCLSFKFVAELRSIMVDFFTFLC